MEDLRMKNHCGAILILFSLIIPLSAQNFWQQTNGPEGGSVQCIKVNLDNEIFAALENERIIYKSSDFGGSWVRLPDLPAALYSMCINAARDMFIGTWSGIYRSQDKGQTWQPINNGLTNLNIESIVCHRTTQNLFAGTYQGGIFRSTENGNSWTDVNSGIANYTTLNILDITFSSSGDAIYAAGAKNGGGGGVYRSTNGGDSWVQINGNLASTNVQSVLEVSTNEILAATYGGGVYKTLDGGTTWNPSTNGLNGDLYFTQLLMGPSSTIYLGSYDRGLFSSTDGGDTWISHASMIVGRDLWDMTYNTVNSDIYVGMRNSGMFRF